MDCTSFKPLRQNILLKSTESASLLDCVENGVPQGKRRSLLPSPSPNTSNISLWNILRNNIGKDLSKVAMPVQLNEPLNTLQRLCEELEYSELLDRAAHTPDPFERMVSIRTYTHLYLHMYNMMNHVKL